MQINQSEMQGTIMNTNNFLPLLTFVFLNSIFFIPPVQAGAGMTEEQMEQMMRSAEKMQECFAKMDQSAMQSLNAKGEKIQAEIKALCVAGKRDQAQNKAMEYGKEIANSKEMQEMKKCTEMAGDMMQHMPMSPGADGDFSGMGHVCDEM
jgi:hypothetical protein